MYNTKAYSAASATSPLAFTTIPRRDLTERDVQIDILYCGICHSDVHSVRNEWSEFMPTVYPIVPGHEIVGRVAKVGSAAVAKAIRSGKIACRFVAVTCHYDVTEWLAPDWVLEIVSESSVRKDTETLRDVYYRAGIREYWIIDARGETIVFQILRWSRADYRATPRRGGWQRSRVFERSFRLERERDDLGLWEYTLHVQ